MQLTDRRLARSRGFSLIEMMVAIAILAIALMAVVPEMGIWQRNLQIRNTAGSVAEGLTKAREEAVRRNRVVRFSLVSHADPAVLNDSCALSATGTSWVVSVADPSGKCGKDISSIDAPMLLARHAGGDGGLRTKLAATDKDGNPATWLTFDQYGRLQASATGITQIVVDSATANPDNRPLTITLTDGGATRMCDKKVKIVGDPRNCDQ